MKAALLWSIGAAIHLDFDDSLADPDGIGRGKDPQFRAAKRGALKRQRVRCHAWHFTQNTLVFQMVETAMRRSAALRS